MASLFIARLTKSFSGGPVLRGVDLAVESGSLVAVLGASGSGKTTLMRLVCGFDRADSGSIELGDEVVSAPGIHVPPDKRRIGYVAQEGALFPHLSVLDNIGFGLPRTERRNRRTIERLLAIVGLPAAYADRAPHQLSGGEQQRVALARALAPNPRLVLLDEPFSSLDAALRAETREAVAAALAASGATAVLVTHDQSEALSMASAVAVLRNGVIAQVAAPETLYREPADAAMARFVGEAVILPGSVRGDSAFCALGRLPLARTTREGIADVMLRPEQIRLTPASSADAVEARVVGVQFNGCDARVRLLLGETALASRVPGHRAPKTGDVVGLQVDGLVMAYPSADADAPPDIAELPSARGFKSAARIPSLQIEENPS